MFNNKNNKKYTTKNNKQIIKTTKIYNKKLYIFQFVTHFFFHELVSFQKFFSKSILLNVFVATQCRLVGTKTFSKIDLENNI